MLFNQCIEGHLRESGYFLKWFTGCRPDRAFRRLL